MPKLYLAKQNWLWLLLPAVALQFVELEVEDGSLPFAWGFLIEAVAVVLAFLLVRWRGVASYLLAGDSLFIFTGISVRCVSLQALGFTWITAHEQQSVGRVVTGRRGGLRLTASKEFLQAVAERVEEARGGLAVRVMPVCAYSHWTDGEWAWILFSLALLPVLFFRWGEFGSALPLIPLLTAMALRPTLGRVLVVVGSDLWDLSPTGATSFPLADLAAVRKDGRGYRIVTCRGYPSAVSLRGLRGLNGLAAHLQDLLQPGS